MELSPDRVPREGRLRLTNSTCQKQMKPWTTSCDVGNAMRHDVLRLQAGL